MKPTAFVGIVLTCCLVSACSQELTREGAASVLSDHLMSVAPQVVPLGAIEVLAEELLQVDEFTREFRFRLATPALDTLFFFSCPPGRDCSSSVSSIGIWGDEDLLEPDTSDVFAVTLRRSDTDRGWAVTQYGTSMLGTAASLATEEWWFQFRDLASAVSAIDRLVPRPEYNERTRLIRELGEVAGEGNWDRMREVIAAMDALDTGQVPYVMSEIVDSAGIEFPEGITWGHSSDGGGREGAVTWATRAASDLMCAQKADLRSPLPPMSGFRGLGNGLSPWCRRGDEPYRSRLDYFREVREELTRDPMLR